MSNDNFYTCIYWNQQLQQQLSRLQWWYNLCTRQCCAYLYSEMNNFLNNPRHNSHISNNGGAITNISLSFNGTGSFSHNSAHHGGVFSTEQKVACTLTGINNFISNSAIKHSGVIYASGNVMLTFNGANNLINNSAGIKGGAIHANFKTILEFNDTNNFTHSSVKIWYCDPCII